jgi:hypothetical protein
MSSIITFSRVLNSVQRIFAKDCGANLVMFGTPWRHGGGPPDARPGPDLRGGYEDGFTDPILYGW